MSDDRSRIKIDLKNGFLEVEGSDSVIESVIPLIKDMGKILLKYNNCMDKDLLTEVEEDELIKINRNVNEALKKDTASENEDNSNDPGPAFYDGKLSNLENYYTGIFKYLWEELPYKEKKNNKYLLILYFLMLIDPTTSFTMIQMQEICDRISIDFNFSIDQISLLVKKDLIIEDEGEKFEISNAGEELITKLYNDKIKRATKLMRERSTIEFE